MIGLTAIMRSLFLLVNGRETKGGKVGWMNGRMRDAWLNGYIDGWIDG